MKVFYTVWLWPRHMSSIDTAKYVRNNKIIGIFSKLSIYIGLFIIAYDYYLIYLTPFWDFDLLLWMFISGCALVFIGFSGKLWRRGVSRYQKIKYTRTGECISCGACCKLPVRCIFLMKGRCLIHHNRPKQCRSFPSKPSQVVSHKCGYSFEKI